MWGVIAASLFAAPAYGYSGAVNGCSEECAGTGLFYGCGCLLGVTTVFIVANILWTGSLCTIMFVSMNKMGILRVAAEVEMVGMDKVEHGGVAYHSGEAIEVKTAGLGNLKSLVPSSQPATEVSAM
jgi:ammonia channel protein AmtB